MDNLKNILARITKGSDGRVILLTIGLSMSIGLICASFFLAELKTSLILICLLFLSLQQVALTFITLRVRARANDIQFAIALESSLNRSKVNLKEFFYDGAAGTPSLQLYILKIIKMCRPTEILELGSGQTTRLLSGMLSSHPETRVTTLEQDSEWWSILKADVAHERLDYIQSTLITRSTVSSSGTPYTTSWYKDLPENFFSKRFNLIIVDGPDDGLLGTEFSSYARSGLLWHLPKILADSFVIIFDDADMYKHQMAIKLLKDELSAHGISFGSCKVHGIKDQEMVYSVNFKFLASI
jgi:hypothetical protein